MSISNKHKKGIFRACWWLIKFKFALVLLTFLFEVRKELVLDRNIKDKDAQGLKWIKNRWPIVKWKTWRVNCKKWIMIHVIILFYIYKWRNKYECCMLFEKSWVLWTKGLSTKQSAQVIGTNASYGYFKYLTHSSTFKRQSRFVTLNRIR